MTSPFPSGLGLSIEVRERTAQNILMLTRIERQNVPLAPLPISILFCNQTTSHRLHSDARPHFHAGSSVAAPPLPDRAIIIIVTLTSPRETGQKNSELELQPATRRRGTFPMPANYPARRPSLSAVSGGTPTGTPYLPLVSGGGRAISCESIYRFGCQLD